jgi:hypothetical protein
MLLDVFKVRLSLFSVGLRQLKMNRREVQHRFVWLGVDDGIRAVQHGPTGSGQFGSRHRSWTGDTSIAGGGSP